MDFRRKPETLAPILGTSFLSALTDRDTRAPLRIGKDRWSKHDLATQLGIVNVQACALLSSICKKLNVKDTRDLFNSTSPYTFTNHRAGVTTLYAMFAAFRDKGLDVEDWYHKGQKGAMVSFLSLKHRELEAERRAKADERKHRRTHRLVHSRAS
jgi:hypothetical protein